MREELLSGKEQEVVYYMDTNVIGLTELSLTFCSSRNTIFKY